MENTHAIDGPFFIWRKSVLVFDRKCFGYNYVDEAGKTREFRVSGSF